MIFAELAAPPIGARGRSLSFSRSFPGAPALAVSASLHILLVFALLYLPRLGGNKARLLPWIAVDLLSPEEIAPSPRERETAPPAVAGGNAEIRAPEKVPDKLPPVTAPPAVVAPPALDTAAPTARPDIDAATIRRLTTNLRRRLCIRLETDGPAGPDDCPTFTDDLTAPYVSALERARSLLIRDAAELYGPKFAGLSLAVAGRKLGYGTAQPVLVFENRRAVDPTKSWDLSTQVLGPLPVPKVIRQVE